MQMVYTLVTMACSTNHQSKDYDKLKILKQWHQSFIAGNRKAEKSDNESVQASIWWGLQVFLTGAIVKWEINDATNDGCGGKSILVKVGVC